MKYDLEERLLSFPANIIQLTESLPGTRAGNHVAGQLLRSGTSPLANHGEAQAAESPNDFLHKLRICLKELRETFRWLQLVEKAGLIANPPELQALIHETDELIRIFVTSIRTTQHKQAS
jgi:four helix bundle protein